MLKSGAVWKLNRTWLVKKAHNKPEVRKKRSDDAKKRWADPEFKKRVSDAVRKGVNRYYAKQKGMVA